MTKYYAEKKSQTTYWVFFGILGFVAVYFPLFGTSIRYQFGTLFSGFFEIVLSTIGTIMKTIGTITFLLGLLYLICGRSAKALPVMLTGFFFIMIGFFCTGENFLFFLEGRDAPPRPKGYN